MQRLVLFAGLIAVSSSFKINNWFPHSLELNVKEGDSIEINCNVDDWYKTCRLKHVDTGHTCSFDYDLFSNQTTLCQDFQGRYKFIGDFDSYHCGIRITDMKPEEAGKWRCEVKDFDWWVYPEHAALYKTFDVKVAKDEL
jgi:hypothetical protein